jgi:Tol biopolymer transport system component
MRYVLSCLLLSCCLTTSYAQFTAPKILRHPTQIRVERLDILNTLFRETNLNVSPDGKYLFFMSGRGGQPWSNPSHTTYDGRMEHDGDIWYSQKTGIKWGFPICLGQNVNSHDGEDEPNISPDGQTVTFQSWGRAWQSTGGPYYQSSLNATTWGEAQGLGGGINSFFVDRSMAHERRNLGLGPNDYATDGATLSADGKTFIVAVGEYDGSMDLFISRKNALGQWSYLKRLAVSTLGDERSPFLAPDGKTLYFASDGYGGFGGLDIFKTTLNDNDSHGAIVNLGSPFSTYLADYGFILTASGNEAYFVREGDIYFADTKNADPELKPSTSTLMLSGKVTNSKTGKPMLASIKIIDNKTKAILATINSNAYTGEYAVVLPVSAVDFSQEVSQKEFEKDNQNFKVEIKMGLNQVNAAVALKPIEKAPPVVVVPPKKEEAQAGYREKDIR